MPSRLSRAIAAFLTYIFAGPVFGVLAFGLLIAMVTAFSEPGPGLAFLYA